MYSRHFNYNRDENKQKTNRQYGISAEKLNKNDRKKQSATKQRAYKILEYNGRLLHIIL